MEFESFVAIAIVLLIINLFLTLGCLVNACNCSNELERQKKQLHWLEYNVMTQATANIVLEKLDEFKKEYDSDNRTHLRAFRRLEEVVRTGSLEGIAQQLQESRNRSADGLAAYARPGESMAQLVKRWVAEQREKGADLDYLD